LLDRIQSRPYLRIWTLPASLSANEQRTPSTSGFPPNPLGFRRLDAASEVLDLPLRRVELAEAQAVQLLAALPQRYRLVERSVAALEPLHDLLELALCRLERRLTRHGRRTSRRRLRRRSARPTRPPPPNGRSTRRHARSRSPGSASP